MPTPLTPKLRIPLRLDNGRLATVEQDSQDNIAACVYAALAYERGSRIEDPDFGIDDPSFPQFPADLSEALEQIRKYEPRADVATQQDLEDLIGHILVEVGPGS